MMHHHAQTPGEENPTTIMGSDKITVTMKNMRILKATTIDKNNLQGAMNVMSNLTKKTTIIPTTVRNMSKLQIEHSSKANLTAPTTIKSNRDVTTVITHAMIIALKENLMVNRFGMLVMMIRMSPIHDVRHVMLSHITATAN